MKWFSLVSTGTVKCSFSSCCRGHWSVSTENCVRNKKNQTLNIRSTVTVRLKAPFSDSFKAFILLSRDVADKFFMKPNCVEKVLNISAAFLFQISRLKLWDNTKFIFLTFLILVPVLSSTWEIVGSPGFCLRGQHSSYWLIDILIGKYPENRNILSSLRWFWLWWVVLVLYSGSLGLRWKCNFTDLCLTESQTEIILLLHKWSGDRFTTLSPLFSPPQNRLDWCLVIDQ